MVATAVTQDVSDCEGDTVIYADNARQPPELQRLAEFD